MDTVNYWQDNRLEYWQSYWACRITYLLTGDFLASGGIEGMGRLGIC